MQQLFIWFSLVQPSLTSNDYGIKGGGVAHGDGNLFAGDLDQYFLDLAVGFYDITTLGKVGIPSTYLYFGNFTCILNKSQLAITGEHSPRYYIFSSENILDYH